MIAKRSRSKIHGICLGKNHGSAGQMTVEFVVVLPVFLIIAVIAVNALLFFSECAEFDRIARDSIRVHATSPSYEQTHEQSRVQIGIALQEHFKKSYLSSSVSVVGGVGGLATFTAELEFSPTLFGLGLKKSLFGVNLPALRHSVSSTVSVYRPGVLL